MPTILSKETIKRSVSTEIALAIQFLLVRNGKLQQFIRLVKGKYSCFLVESVVMSRESGVRTRTLSFSF